MTNFGVVTRGSTEAQVVGNRRGVTSLDHRPNIPGPYVWVETGDPEFDTDQSPAWQNDFYFVTGSPVGFRHGLDGYVEFVGRLDLTLGAVTGTVAFTLPTPWRAISFDFTFPIFVESTEWQAGVLSIDSASGDVTVYWPIQAIAI